MKAPAAALTAEEYLNTSIEGPDREYVDGETVERNVGEKDHSRTQRILTNFFGRLEASLRTFAFPEQRIQVGRTRYRVPDLCVYVGAEPAEQVFVTPPFLVVEILSRDDRASEVQEKIDDYLAFGVPFVWVIDPRTRGYIHTPEGSREAKHGVLRTAGPEIALPLAEVFASWAA